MNFNGKFWHKPGHLGMTTPEVKKALQALPTPEAGDAGKAVIVNADADGYELGEAGGGDSIIINGTLAMKLVNGVTQVIYSMYHSDDNDDAQAFLNNIITEIGSGKRIFVKFAGEIMGTNMFETTDCFIAYCQDGENVYIEGMLGYISGGLEWYTFGVAGDGVTGYDVCVVINVS